MASRPHVPADLERALYEEAGHRCAIPTCRNTSVLEMAHIIPRAIVQEDRFENMIVLCATCHGLYDREKKISRKSMENYKLKLAVVNGRYGDFERRVLQFFIDNQHVEGVGLSLTFHHQIHLLYLLRDGIIELAHRERHIMSGSYEEGIEIYVLTPHGKNFINRWVEAESEGVI